MDGLSSLLSADLPLPMHHSSAQQKERMARLRLAGTERIGPVTFAELLTRHGSAAAALAALPSYAERAGLQRPLRVPRQREVEQEAERLERQGGRFLVLGDPSYPASLAALPDAPPVLRCIGDVTILQRPMIAVVGARNGSANGRRLAADFASDLGAAGFVIVSGLARGIDAAAHQAALATGTVAVLAGGVDHVYPPENESLHQAIAADGLLLSEMPCGVVPQARHFPRRNRIIAGLSAGVVVIEAAVQSGSLITAHRALDQGREVFAVPGSPLDPRCRGCNQLLRQGAHLAESAEDILAELPPAGIAPQVPACTPKYRKKASRPVRHAGDEALRSPHCQPVGAPDTSQHVVEIAKENTNRPIRDQILECLGPSPTPVDEVVRRCQVSAAAVQAILLELELAGRLERHRGNAVSLL